MSCIEGSALIETYANNIHLIWLNFNWECQPNVILLPTSSTCTAIRRYGLLRTDTMCDILRTFFTHFQVNWDQTKCWHFSVFFGLLKENWNHSNAIPSINIMAVISPYAVAGSHILHLTARHINVTRPPSDRLSEAMPNDDIKPGWITDWNLLLLLKTTAKTPETVVQPSCIGGIVRSNALRRRSFSINFHIHAGSHPVTKMVQPV